MFSNLRIKIDKKLRSPYAYALENTFATEKAWVYVAVQRKLVPFKVNMEEIFVPVGDFKAQPL